MEDANFALLVIGFFLGYIIKSFLTFRSGWSATAHLVRKVGDQCLKLMGTIVYKVSFMDQLYQRSIALTLDSELAKLKFCNRFLRLIIQICYLALPITLASSEQAY